jgi:RNA-binding protein YlmH
MSPRLDAVAAGLFHLSRMETARQIALGLLSLNYSECLKPDAPVREGDVLSLRGAGKGRVREIGGSSRKGRLFVTAELYR